MGDFNGKMDKHGNGWVAGRFCEEYKTNNGNAVWYIRKYSRIQSNIFFNRLMSSKQETLNYKRRHSHL